MFKFFVMGLKPLDHQHSKNPFTKVNGNRKALDLIVSRFIAVSFSRRISYVVG